MADELKERGLNVKCQQPIEIIYNNKKYDQGFRADIVVEGKVILELKSVEKIGEVHKKQLQTYLKLSNSKLGFLLNFGQALMKDGIVRCVNGLREEIEREPLPKDFFKN